MRPRLSVGFFEPIFEPTLALSYFLNWISPCVALIGGLIILGSLAMQRRHFCKMTALDTWGQLTKLKNRTLSNLSGWSVPKLDMLWHSFRRHLHFYRLIPKSFSLLLLRRDLPLRRDSLLLLLFWLHLRRMGARVRYIMPQRRAQLLAVVGEDLRIVCAARTAT